MSDYTYRIKTMSQDTFSARHIGPRPGEVREMLEAVGVQSLDALIEQTVPHDIRLPKKMSLPAPMSEAEYLGHIHGLARKNRILRSLIGRGYYGTQTPAVIQRNVFENPSWYTSYTPYQAEISQGRLEALLNFQTMVSSLTGLPMANASLLDEGTAAAEAMLMMHSLRSRAAVKENRQVLFVDDNVFPQTVEVIVTRAEPLGIEVVRGCYSSYTFTGREFGAVVQYPDSKGEIRDYRAFAEAAHGREVLVAVAADILSLALLEAPGAWGADIALGSTQRLGIPFGCGGPSAGYFATHEKYKRNIPGRIVGVSIDRHGRHALRLSLQTREQHIKREKATSNICTAQALLATMAGLYAVYQGPEGLRRIAMNAHSAAAKTAEVLRSFGCAITRTNFFDTLHVQLPEGASQERLREEALAQGYNFYYCECGAISIAFDELSTAREVTDVIGIFARALGRPAVPVARITLEAPAFDKKFARATPMLEEKVFNIYRSETEMMRYIKQLERKDISLTHSMIPLGSCTMKLNSAASMLPLSWPEFTSIHPFAPADQMEGYMELIDNLGKYLSEITGFASTTFQPNSGASGEYTGLMIIRKYHLSRGNAQRTTILIPTSAHGTNPASAAMAGANIVLVECDAQGNINVEDLEAKAKQHADTLCAFMVTYPSTHGIFESKIRRMVDIVHAHGGLVYMDGANMNGQVGLTSPGYIGADVCHLNLHKTFAIPHGGGGPGVGSVSVTKELAQFLPTHCMVKVGGENGISAVAASPWGSAYVLPIVYGYIRMMGEEGLTRATEVAILNANYMAARLKTSYGIVYTGETGRVGHECIVDCRDCREAYGVETADIARRLMDYGFHAPTLSFPVHETLMAEPTESESKAEIDRFCDALIAIKEEMQTIGDGKMPKDDNPLVNAPHTAEEVAANDWLHPYSREQAAYPLPWIRLNKFWPSVSRIDNAYGDRNLVCTCAPIESYIE